jgi:hypothetical protein
MKGKVDMKKSAAILLYGAIGLLIFFWATSGFCANIQRVTKNTIDDTDVDIAKDSSGKVHLVYKRSGNIYYWSNSDLHSNGKEEFVAKGGSAAIAIGPNGVPQVAYAYAGAQHTQRKNGKWQAPQLVSPSWGDYGNSGVSDLDLAVDNVNDTYFVYTITNPYSSYGYNDLYVTTKKNGVISNYYWLHSGDYDGFGDYSFGENTSNPAIAVDDNVNIHVAAEFKQEQSSIENPEFNETTYSIRTFRNINTRAPVSTVSEGEKPDLNDIPVAMASKTEKHYLSDSPIVADSEGKLHLAYHVGQELFVTNWNGNNWTKTLSAAGRNGSLSYNSKDHSVAIAYVDGVTIYYRIDYGKGFSHKQYVSGGAGPSIALGSIDVAYAKATNSSREIFWASDLENPTNEDVWILFTPAIINKK